MRRPIILVRPPSGAGDTFSKIGALQPPMNLFAIREFLKREGFDCAVVDFHLGEARAWGLLESLCKRGGLVGVSFSLLDFPGASLVAKKAKEISKSSVVVAGGAYPSAEPEKVLDCLSFDACVIGEGERAFEEIAMMGRHPDFGKIRGLAFRKGGKISITRPRLPERNLDRFPFVDRKDPEFSKNYAESISPLRAERTAYVMFSRGCPYKCAFCQSGGKTAVLGKVWRARSVGSAISEMESIADSGYGYVQVSDDIFGLDRKWLLGFCERMVETGLSKKLKWSAATRADLLTEEVARALKLAGCVKIGMGLESGSPKILKAMGKGETVRKIRRGFSIAKRAGIPTYAFVVVGFPGETKRDFALTERLVLEIDPDYLLAMAFVPIPGTAGHEISISRGLYTGKEGGEGYFLTSGAVMTGNPIYGGMTREEVGRARDGLYFKFYSRPKKILSEISKLRSPRQISFGLNAARALLKVSGLFRAVWPKNSHQNKFH